MKATQVVQTLLKSHFYEQELQIKLSRDFFGMNCEDILSKILSEGHQNIAAKIKIISLLEENPKIRKNLFPYLQIWGIRLRLLFLMGEEYATQSQIKQIDAVIEKDKSSKRKLILKVGEILNRNLEESDMNFFSDFLEKINLNFTDLQQNGNKSDEKSHFIQFFFGRQSRYDEKIIMQSLKGESQKYKIHLQYPKKFKEMIRKYQIKDYDFDTIGTDLLKQKLKSSEEINLALSLKYGFLNGAKVEKRTLDEIIKKNCKNHAMVTALKKISQTEENIPLINNENPRMELLQKQARIDAIKSQTKAITQSQELTTEQEQLKFQNLYQTLTLKNEEKTPTKQTAPLQTTQEGTDLSFWDGTYECVKNLYNRALNGWIIKRYDKDEYLPSKFMNSKIKFFTHGIFVGDFFVDLLISEIFTKISQRQQLSCLTKRQMFEIIEDRKRLVNMLNLKNSGYAFQKFIDYASKKENWVNKPHIIRMMMDDIKKNPIQTAKIVDDIVEKIRANALQALYNSYKRESYSLSEQKVSILKNLLKDNNQQVKSKASKILALKTNSQQMSKTLFESYLKQLDSMINIEDSINYLFSQSKDKSRIHFFEEKHTIKTIVNSLTRIAENSLKRTIVQIINNYLLNSKRALSESYMWHFVSNIRKKHRQREMYNADLQNFRNQVLLLMLVSIQLNNKLSKRILDGLITADEFDAMGRVLLLRILSQSLESIDLKDPQIIMSFLEDDRILVVSLGKNIQIEERGQSNEEISSLSNLAALVILDSLQKNMIMTNELFTKMLYALSSSDKQTRIIISKALFEAKHLQIYNESDIQRLQCYFDDPIAEVSKFSRLSFVKYLKQSVQRNFQSINLFDLQGLADSFEFHKLIVNGIDYTEQINKDIVHIISQYSPDMTFTYEPIFDVINQILTKDEFSEFHEKCLKIIFLQASKQGKLPESTITCLYELIVKNKYEKVQLVEEVTQILKVVILKGQQVNEKILKYFSDCMLESENQNVRQQAYLILKVYQQKHEIDSQETYFQLEMQKACEFISNKKKVGQKEGALYFLEKKIRKGYKLSPYGFSVLEKQIENSITLSILSYNSVMQMIPSQIFTKVIEMLFSHFSGVPQNQQSILRIVENTIANNIVISDKNITDLSRCIKFNRGNRNRLLNILGNLIERDCKVPIFVIQHLCDAIFNDSECNKSNLLHALISLIRTKKVDLVKTKNMLFEMLMKIQKNKQTEVLVAQALYAVSSILKFKNDDLKMVLNCLKKNYLSKLAEKYLRKIFENRSNLTEYAKRVVRESAMRELTEKQFIEGISLKPAQFAYSKESVERIAKMIDNSIFIEEIMPFIEISFKQTYPPEVLILSLQNLQKRTNSEQLKIQISKILKEKINEIQIEIEGDSVIVDNMTEMDIEILEILMKILPNLNRNYLMGVIRSFQGKLQNRKLLKVVKALEKSSTSINQLSDLVQFIAEYKIDEHMILPSKIISGKQMLKQLQIKTLAKISQIQQNQYERCKFEKMLNQLLSNPKWDFNSVKFLIELQTKTDKNTLMQLLETVHNFQVSSQFYKKTMQKITKVSTQRYEIFCKQVINSEFHQQITYRSKDEIINQLKQQNKQNEKLTQIINKGYEILEHNPEQKPISEWTQQDICSWVKKAKQTKNFQYEKLENIFIIARANQLITKHTLRETQILSTILLLKTSGNKGRLLQVSTGEGKSTIISIFAIIKALQGFTVDIVTSSPVLAQRDCKEKRKLYKLFGLKCGHNNDDSGYIAGPKKCYQQNIVYGEASQFQFDTLRDTYSNLGTLCKRKKQIVIVDEVDSMLIDNSSRIARLATSIAGLDTLQPIYHYLWHRLLFLQEKILQIEGKFYLIYGKIQYTQNQMSLQYYDSEKELKQIKNLKHYLKTQKDISSIGKQVIGDIEDFIKDKLKKFLQELLDLGQPLKENQDPPQKFKIKIPKNFNEYVKIQIPKWIQSALTALTYQQNVQYVIQNGVIKPVDYNSTGLVQSYTNWSDGLHQFLQIKHSLKMTSESMTTNFLSNMGYFKKYKHLYGLTGTLGSKNLKSVFEEIYKVDLVIIPRSCEQQYKQFETIAVQTRRDWIKQITQSSINESSKKRGTLIICESIGDASDLARQIKKKYRDEAVKLYILNDQDQQQDIERIGEGEIIVATNLAGRGTDIKTEEINEYGGMHVILTFLPSNQRVQDQAFGRTARQGKRGTGQMIIKSSSSLIKNLISDRDTRQAEILKEFQKKQLKLITLKDELFSKFSLLINEIREKMKGNWWEKILKYFGGSIHEQSILAAIEEQWAMFLLKIDRGLISFQNAQTEYSEFERQIRDKFENDLKRGKGIFDVIKNPFYHIAIAHDIAAKSILTDDQYKLAYRHYELAIKKDPDFSGAAHFGIAWLLIKGKTRILIDNKKSKNYKDESVNEFREAMKIASEEMSILASLQALSGRRGLSYSQLSKQIVLKMNMMGTYLNSLEKNIENILKSKRKIDIVHENRWRNQKKYYKNLVRGQKGGLIKEGGQIFRLGETSDLNQYSITFNHLTYRNDTGTIDQAIQTIKAIQEEDIYVITSENYLSHDKLRTLFCPHQKYQNLKKSDIIAQIDLHFNLIERSASKLKDKIQNCNILNNKTLESLLPISPLKHQILIEVKFHQNIIFEKSWKAQTQTRYTQIISWIQNQHNDQAITFNLTILNANKTYEQFLKVANLQTLHIKFEDLQLEKAIQRIEGITLEIVEVELVGSKEKLKQAIEFVHILTMNQIIIKGQQRSVQIKIVEGGQKINEFEDNLLSVVLDSQIKKDQILQFLRICQKEGLEELLINTTLRKSYFNGSVCQNIRDRKAKITQCANKKEAIKMIQFLRKQGIGFKLSCLNLSAKTLQRIIKITEKIQAQQQIIVDGKKTLATIFFKDKDKEPPQELFQFSNRGIQYLLEVGERNFIPWRSIGILMLIAGVQIAVGGALIASGFGASIGFGLITEGIADVCMAAKAYLTRDFKWSEYAQQKAISLAISAISMGMGQISNGCIGAKNLAQGVQREIAEQAGTKLIADKLMKKTGKQLSKMACETIGLRIATIGLREASEKVAELALNQFRPKIYAFLQTKAENKFFESNLGILLRQLYTIEALENRKFHEKRVNSNHLKNRIQTSTERALSTKQNNLHRYWKQIGGYISRAIESSEYSSSTSLVMRIIGTLNGVMELNSIIEKIYENLFRKISQSSKQQKFIDEIKNHVKIPEGELSSIENHLKIAGVLFKDKNSQFQLILTERWDKCKIQRPNFVTAKSWQMTCDFLTNYAKLSQSIQFDSIQEILKKVSENLADHICAIIDTSLMQPKTNFDYLGDRLEEALPIDGFERVDQDTQLDEGSSEMESNESSSESEQRSSESIPSQGCLMAEDWS